MLTSATRRPEIRLVRDGERVDPRAYCTTLRLGGRQVSDVIDPARVAELVADGATLVLQSLHRTRSSVGRFATELEAEASHPVQANAYLTPAGAAGLAPHADRHDVLVLQLHGTKAWDVEGLGGITLGPGDTLYIPAGCEHRAETQASASLHLTIGLLRVTHRAVLERLVRDLDGIDRPLPLGYARDASPDLRVRIEQLLAEAAKHLESADAAAIADRERRRRRPRPRHEGHLESVLRLPELERSTVLRLRPGPAPTVDVRADGTAVRLDLGDRVLRLPVAARAALEALLTGDGVEVGRLPGLDDDSQVVLARRLVREGMLTIVG
jgi:mannose-6-phosphate isomerase-like protein (cupin superfamily)